MDKKIIILGLALGAVAIILGAFGAHGLKKNLTIDQLNSFEVGVRYMIYHALFLLFIGTNTLLLPQQKNIVFLLTLFGVLLFSSSIFLLTTQSITKINFKFLGPVTPLGGILLISAWITTIFYIFTKKV